MMEDVPENEWHTAPPAVRPTNNPVPAQRDPAAESPPLDPEQVRQFQQFQQFQELMKQGGVPPTVLPPAKRPLWQRVLRSKPVRWLVILFLLLATLPIWGPLLLAGLIYVWIHLFLSHEDNRPASETGGGTYHTNHILKDNPYDAVRQVYQRVADNSPDFACGVFTDEAAQQFANHVNAADCPAAIAKLNGEIDKSQPGWLNGYAEPDFHGRMGEVPSADTITISSCDLGVTAGPRLGAFTLNRVDKGQWLITGHQRESC